VAEWHSVGLREISAIGLHPVQKFASIAALDWQMQKYAQLKVCERLEGGAQRRGQ